MSNSSEFRKCNPSEIDFIKGWEDQIEKQENKSASDKMQSRYAPGEMEELITAYQEFFNLVGVSCKDEKDPMIITHLVVDGRSVLMTARTAIAWLKLQKTLIKVNKVEEMMKE